MFQENRFYKRNNDIMEIVLYKWLNYAPIFKIIETKCFIFVFRIYIFFMINIALNSTQKISHDFEKF